MEYLEDHLKEKIADRIRRAPHIFCFLDYDGTLTPIMPKPEMAKLRPSTRKVLQKLVRKPRFSIGVITGRKLDEIQSLVAVKNMIYGGNQGLELQGPDFRYTHAKTKEFRRILSSIRFELEPMSKIFPGCFIEDKRLTLTCHYRLVDERSGPALRIELHKRLLPWIKTEKADVVEAKKAFEIRPNVNWNKGAAVRWILLHEQPESLPVYLGDDKTDEHAFKALDERGITIRVGYEKGSRAQYFLKDVFEVEKFLSFLSAVKNHG